MRAIRLTDDAADAWKILKDRYEAKGFFLISQYIKEFLSMTYNESQDIAAFNGTFKDMLAKMLDAGLEPFSLTFLITLYLQWVGHVYPTWAERQRSVLRTLTNTRTKPIWQTLEDMMTDLVDENRAVTNAAQNGNGTGISMYGNRPQP